MITIYKIGFEILSKEILGPWPIPKTGDRIMKLHSHIGLGDIIHESKNRIFMVILKPLYESKIRSLEKKKDLH